MYDSALNKLEILAKEAVQCENCFIEPNIKRALVDLAQPPWVGSSYFDSSPRIMLVLINPGSGEYRQNTDNALDTLRCLLHDFKQNKIKLEAILEHKRKDMPKWGGGNLWEFYIEGLKLNPSQISLINIAWCAANKNAYRSDMLNNCFNKFTSKLFPIFNPDIVLLSGNPTHEYSSEIKEILPNVKIIPMRHYAYYYYDDYGDENKNKKTEELNRVLNELKRYGYNPS